MLVGLEGGGKSALLDVMCRDASALGVHAHRVEVPDRPLPAFLAPQLRATLLSLSKVDAARAQAQRGLRALAGFVAALKVTFPDIEAGLSLEPEAGLADNGDLEHDLSELLLQVGLAAKAAGTAVVLFIDEAQNIPAAQMAALIMALHRYSQESMPVILVGAGLPQVRQLTGEAMSYAERLSDFLGVDAQPQSAAG
jgi:hypothetical protein